MKVHVLVAPLGNPQMLPSSVAASMESKMPARCSYFVPGREAQTKVLQNL